MEQVDLTAPIQPPSVSNYRIQRLTLDWSASCIDITLVDNVGGTTTATYAGQVATDLMVSLNTANLSVKSLHKRVLEKLIADGKLSGTISGTP